MKKIAVSFVALFVCALAVTNIPRLCSAEILAQVNILNPEVVSVADGQYAISFGLKNSGKFQGNIKYAVEMVPFDGGEPNPYVIADEHVYDETLDMLSGEYVKKTVKYEVPQSLVGKYRMMIIGKNSNSLPLFSMMVADLDLNGTSGIFIDQSSCYLSVAGESDSLKYTLAQGVDVLPSETLNLNCQAKNLGSEAISATPSVVTHLRTNFGDVVGAPIASGQFSFEPKETKQISVSLPKPENAQAYNSLVSLTNGADVSVSNSITAHWVLHGASATIQNIYIDKTSYKAGDAAKVSFVWTGTADSFDGSRLGSSTGSLNAVAEISLCGTTKDFPLDANNDGNISETMSVTQTCDDPSVEVKITDNSKVLSVLSANMVNPKKPQSTGDWSDYLNFYLITFIAIILLAVLIVVLKIHHKNQAISRSIFSLLLFGLLYSLTAHSVSAAGTTLTIKSVSMANNTITLSSGSLNDREPFIYHVTGTAISGLYRESTYQASCLQNPATGVPYSSCSTFNIYEINQGDMDILKSSGNGTQTIERMNASTYTSSSGYKYNCNIAVDSFPAISPVYPATGLYSFDQDTMINMKASASPTVACYYTDATVGPEVYSASLIVKHNLVSQSTGNNHYKNKEDNNDRVDSLTSPDTFAGSEYTGSLDNSYDDPTIYSGWYDLVTRVVLSADNEELAGNSWSKRSVYITEIDSPDGVGAEMTYSDPVSSGNKYAYNLHLNSTSFYPGQPVTVTSDFSNSIIQCSNGALGKPYMNYEVYKTANGGFSSGSYVSDMKMNDPTSPYFYKVSGSQSNYVIANKAYSTQSGLQLLSPGSYYGRFTLFGNFNFHDSSRNGLYNVGVYTISFTVNPYPSVGLTVASQCNNDPNSSTSTATLSWASLPYVLNTVYYDTDAGGSVTTQATLANGATVAGYQIARYNPVDGSTVKFDNIYNYTMISSVGGQYYSASPIPLTYNNATIGNYTVDTASHKLIVNDTSALKGISYKYSIYPIFGNYWKGGTFAFGSAPIAGPVMLDQTCNNNSNHAPATPTVTGAASSIVLTSVPYSVVSTDPDGDDISYDIAYDGTSTVALKTATTTSGSPISGITHVWKSTGGHTVYARARDSKGALSDWGSLAVNITNNGVVANSTPITATCSVSPTSLVLDENGITNKATFTVTGTSGGTGSGYAYQFATGEGVYPTTPTSATTYSFYYDAAVSNFQTQAIITDNQTPNPNSATVNCGTNTVTATNPNSQLSLGIGPTSNNATVTGTNNSYNVKKGATFGLKWRNSLPPHVKLTNDDNYDCNNYVNGKLTSSDSVWSNKWTDSISADGLNDKITTSDIKTGTYDFQITCSTHTTKKLVSSDAKLEVYSSSAGEI